MRAKDLTAAAAIALGLGLTGLGAGVGMASADPGHNPPPCGGACHGGPQHPGGGGNGIPGRGGPPSDQQRWDERGRDQGRYDHQPFNYQGQRAEPYFDNQRGAWGFWFLGQWMGL